MKSGYKFRIYPNLEQEIAFKKTFGCCRFIYNYGLSFKKDLWKKEQKTVGYNKISAAMTKLRKSSEFSWLNEVSFVALQQSLRNLDAAYSKFFKKQTRHPNFKKRKNGGSAKFVGSGFRLKGDLFYIAKIKTPIKVVWSRKLPSKPSSCTVSQNPSGQWFVSFTCETEITPLPKTNKQIGIDLGVETFATLSDGTKIKQPDLIRKSRKKLAKVQKTHSRKKLGSKNREKARLKVARVYQKIANTRSDFLHKLSISIVRENQVIAIEDLTIQNMAQKGNRKLSRLIGEQGWREFRTMLEYKAGWYGREIIVVDKYLPSSQTCNACGKINKASLDKRSVTCECGVTYDRDINAAKNILAAGVAVSACGTGVRLPRKRLVAKQEVNN